MYFAGHSSGGDTIFTCWGQSIAKITFKNCRVFIYTPLPKSTLHIPCVMVICYVGDSLFPSLCPPNLNVSNTTHAQWKHRVPSRLHRHNKLWLIPKISNQWRAKNSHGVHVLTIVPQPKVYKFRYAEDLLGIPILIFYRSCHLCSSIYTTKFKKNILTQHFW